MLPYTLSTLKLLIIDHVQGLCKVLAPPSSLKCTRHDSYFKTVTTTVPDSQWKKMRLSHTASVAEPGFELSRETDSSAEIPHHLLLTASN